MHRRLLTIVLALVLAHGLAGCDSTPAQSPLTPSPVPQAAPQPPQPTGSQLRGTVLDSAFRPLGGATVEVVDGPQAGTSTTTDATGEFRLTGTFDETIHFRASKDGHVTATQTLAPCPSCNPNNRWIGFYLAVLDPPVNIAGDYTLTFIAATACAGLPTEVRTRTYAASITAESNSFAPPNTYFTARVSGAPFLDGYDGFPIGVAGGSVTFELRGHGPYLVEQVAANTYLGFDGWAQASVGTSAVSTISASFDGVIDYCALKSEMGRYYYCAPAQAVAQAQCVSTNHRLILTRR